MNINASAPVQILVVEDEWVVAIDVKACLEELGYSVVEVVVSGEEAIVKARELHPSIVLMDIRLAGEIDGVQATQQIWNELQIPSIYMTGYSDKITVERAAATDAFGYILKPVREQDLQVAVKTALQRHGRETQLREQQQWTASILKAIGDGVIVTDREGQVKFLNLVAQALTGWQLQEAINRPLSEVFPLINSQTQEPAENPITEVLRTGNVTYLVDPVLLITKSEQQILIADSAAPIKDDQGKLAGAVMVFRDVTEQQSLQAQSFSLLQAQLLKHQMQELQLKQQIQELQQFTQLKDDFLNTVSHELRSPLASIKMTIELLEVTLDRYSFLPSCSDNEVPSQRLEKYLRVLREQCDQEINLVNNLLDLQRLEAEKVPNELTAIDLLEWIPHVAEVFQWHAQQNQQCLQLQLPSALPSLISNLPTLTHILRELLTNACKYTPSGGVITVSAQQEEEQLKLVVSNSGIEISNEELPHIFDKFYQISRGDRRNNSGTGLGLALIKRQVEYLGGTIWAESYTNKVHFVIKLPFVV